MTEEKPQRERLGFFKLLLLILIALNTFFIGSIWLKMNAMCGYTNASGQKICPFTQWDKGSLKGSAGSLNQTYQ